MGYMGFGMRKEVYTRKPKEAFKKLKAAYGKQLKFPKPKKNQSNPVSNSFEKHSYEPFFLTWYYKAFKLVLALSIVGWTVWWGLLKDPFFDYQRNKFEEKEFVAFYHTKIPQFKRAFKFLQSRTNKTVRLGYKSRYDSYDIYIKSIKLDTLNPYNLRFKSFEGIHKHTRTINHDQIVNGSLTVPRDKHLNKTYRHSWEYGMRSVVLSQVPVSMIQYLDTDKSEFATFLEDLKAIGETIRIKKDSIHVNFLSPRFGKYTLIYSILPPQVSSQLKEGYYYNTLVGKLDDNVYWIRKEKVRS